MCHPILVLLFLHDFDVGNARVGAERNPLKTDVIFNVNDLGAAPPEWGIGDVRSLAKTSAVTDGSITLGVAVGSRQFIADQLLGKSDVIRATHERGQLCQDPQTEFALLRESLGVSRINNILRIHCHTILQEQRAVEVYDEIGQRSLERLFLGLTEDSMTQTNLSAGQSRIGDKGARDIAAPAHLGALIAAKPRIQAVIQDAVWAGLLPEQILEARLSEVIEAATSTYPSALDNDEQATAKLCVQKVAPADEAWQQTTGGLQGPGVSNPTIVSLEHPSSASQGEDSDDMDSGGRRAGSRLRGSKTCAARRSLTSGSTTWTRAREVFLRRTTTLPMFRRDLATESGWEVASADAAVPSWTHNWKTQETCRNAEATRGHYACVRAVVCAMKLADPGITTEPRRLTASQSRPTDIFTATAAPGRSAALDVCSGSSRRCCTDGIRS